MKPDDLAGLLVDHSMRVIAGPMVKDRFEALEKRIADLEARPPGVEYGGTFEAGTIYSKSILVQRGGSLWLSLQDGNAWPPGQSAAHWKLIVKRGEA